MASDIDEFVNRFHITNIQVNRDRRHSTFASYGKTASYYNAHEETIDIEIPRSGFEELVRVNRRFDDYSREAGDEAYMRRQHPAIKDAYDKYRMLLELYR